MLTGTRIASTSGSGQRMTPIAPKPASATNGQGRTVRRGLRHVTTVATTETGGRRRNTGEDAAERLDLAE